MKYEHGGDIYSNRGVRLDFSVNVNPLGMPEFVARAARESIGRCAGYPDSGCGALRRAVGRRYGMPEDAIIFGNGAAELIYDIVRAVKPERAAVRAPSFLEYGRALASAGAETVTYYLKEEDEFKTGWDHFLSFLEREKPQMVFLCNPSNPAGVVEERADLERVLSYCGDNRIFVVIDECFLDFTENPGERSCVSFVKSGMEHVFVLQALTKTFAMAGLRLGYGFLRNRELLERMAGARQPWSVSIPAQAAGLAAFGPEREPFLERTRSLVRAEKRLLADALTSSGFRLYGSHVNYLFFRDMTGRGDGEFYRYCLEHGILIRSCANFGGLDGSYYRICVRKHEENQEFICLL